MARSCRAQGKVDGRSVVINMAAIEVTQVVIVKSHSGRHGLKFALGSVMVNHVA